MNTYILLVFLIFSLVLADHEKELPRIGSRGKRSATGALHIVTNHAQPIHADVKSENDGAETPCPKAIRPSHIEPGVGFKVTPPEDAAAVYAMKSLRKSAPLQYMPPTALSLLRSITRVVTFVIVFVSAVLEFYTTFQNLINSVVNFFQ